MFSTLIKRRANESWTSQPNFHTSIFTVCKSDVQAIRVHRELAKLVNEPSQSVADINDPKHTLEQAFDSMIQTLFALEPWKEYHPCMRFLITLFNYVNRTYTKDGVTGLYKGMSQPEEFILNSSDILYIPSVIVALFFLNDKNQYSNWLYPSKQPPTFLSLTKRTHNGDNDSSDDDNDDEINKKRHARPVSSVDGEISYNRQPMLTIEYPQIVDRDDTTNLTIDTNKLSPTTTKMIHDTTSDELSSNTSKVGPIVISIPNTVVSRTVSSGEVCPIVNRELGQASFSEVDSAILHVSMLSNNELALHKKESPPQNMDTNTGNVQPLEAIESGTSMEVVPFNRKRKHIGDDNDDDDKRDDNDEENCRSHRRCLAVTINQPRQTESISIDTMAVIVSREDGCNAVDENSDGVVVFSRANDKDDFEMD